MWKQIRSAIASKRGLLLGCCQVAARSSLLEPGALERVQKGIAVFLSLPFNPTVSGASWEGIFAHGVGGAVSGTGGVPGGKGSKTLFDVVRGETGWSCKTLLMPGHDPRGRELEFVIKRADVLRKYGLEMVDPYELADRIMSDRNDEYTKSADAQGVSDPRVGILLRDRAQRHFAYWEEDYGLFELDEYDWTWGSDQQISVVARHKTDGFMKFRWYRSGAQLFEVFKVPNDALLFDVEWRPHEPEEIWELLYRDE
jgi:hypothetical protein